MSFYLFCQLQGHPFPFALTLPIHNQPLDSLSHQQLYLNYFGMQNHASLTLSTLCPPATQIEVDHALPRGQERNHGSEGRRKARRVCIEKQIKSAKKNGESNLINQLLSFLSTPQKSMKMVKKAIFRIIKCQVKAQKVNQIFYNIVRLINIKRARKYVNKNTLLSYFTISSWQRNIPEIITLLQQNCDFAVEDICCVFRTVCYEFVRNYALPAVLTSKRISMVAKMEHLRKIRLLKRSLARPLEEE